MTGTVAVMAHRQRFFVERVFSSKQRQARRDFSLDLCHNLSIRICCMVLGEKTDWEWNMSNKHSKTERGEEVSGNHMVWNMTWI